MRDEQFIEMKEKEENTNMKPKMGFNEYMGLLVICLLIIIGIIFGYLTQTTKLQNSSGIPIHSTQGPK